MRKSERKKKSEEMEAESVRESCKGKKKGGYEF